RDRRLLVGRQVTLHFDCGRPVGVALDARDVGAPFTAGEAELPGRVVGRIRIVVRGQHLAELDGTRTVCERAVRRGDRRLAYDLQARLRGVVGVEDSRVPCLAVELVGDVEDEHA